MRVTITALNGLRLESLATGRYLYGYTLQAANGLIETEEADVYLPVGHVLDLPDEEWQPNSEVFYLKCDRCGLEYEKKTVRGNTVICPVCNQEEVIPNV